MPTPPAETPVTALLDLLVGSRGALAVALFGMAALALTTGLYAYLVGPLLAFLFTGGEQGYGAFFALVPWVDPSQLDRRALTLALPAVIMAVAALKGVAYYVQMERMGRVGQRLAARLRRQMFDALLGAEPRAALQLARRGDVATRLGADVDTVHEGLVQSVAAFVRDGLTLVVLMALAVWLDWALALLAFVVLPLAIAPIARFARRMRRSTHRGHEARGALAADVVELLAGRQTLRTRAAVELERARYLRHVDTIESARMQAITAKAVNHPIMEFLGVGGLAATLWFAGFRIWSGALEPASFVSFFAAVLMLYEPLKGLSRATGWLHEARAGYDRIAPILALPALDDGTRDARPLQRGIDLHGVALAHGEAAPVLTDVEVSLGRATTTVLTGPSGVGKTTLLRAIAGLAAPCRGRLTWDGVDYAELRRAALAQRIGYLDQEAHVFGRTVRENLTMGLEMGDDWLETCLQRAGALEFVAARGGLDATLAEAATDLSGGQRRRLALARALCQGPDLLLLDEPTDAVDPATEAHILATLRELSGACTMVIVAHRPERIPWADQVIVLSARGARRLTSPVGSATGHRRATGGADDPPHDASGTETVVAE